MGRPPRQTPPAELCRRLEEVEAENRELREQLTVAEVRRELAQALPQVSRAAAALPSL
ncbi:MAG: hypothetical protein HUU20_27935 [Pirellulales bacterium]|nr:hypothetical protein [Pirellulales bacterium]